MGTSAAELRRLAALAETAATVAARSQLGDPDYRLDGTALGDACARVLDEIAAALAELADDARNDR